MTTQEIHFKLIHMLTEYDRKQELKPHHNRYAMGHYCTAVQAIEDDLGAGKGIRRAILSHLCGNLADKALKIVGEPKMTEQEKRGSLADYGY